VATITTAGAGTTVGTIAGTIAITIGTVTDRAG
jgi:hypothetical protein